METNNTRKKKIAKISGQVIKRRRQAAIMTQEELAFAAGLDRSYVSLLERGLREPLLGTLFQLGEGLGCSITVLVAEIEHLVLES